MSDVDNLISSFKSGNMQDFERIALNIKKGISGTGGLIGETVNLIGGNNRVSLEPGDMVLTGPDGKPLIQTASPIAYDLWYLPHACNILEQEDVEKATEANKDNDFISESILNDRFSFLSDHLGNLKPLKIIANLADIAFNDNYDDYFGSGVPWKSNGKYFVHLLGFESWLFKLAEIFTSNGASKEHGFDRNSVCGYLSFPVGQLGVIEVIAIVRESEFESVDFDLTKDLQPDTSTTSDYFFPPVNNDTGKNICMGDHIMESAYLVPEAVRRNLEYPSSPLKYGGVTKYTNGIGYVDAGYIYPDSRPQGWMRYWIHGDEEKFVPGEFIGIVCKPLALPPHPWWFQENSPLLFAGNWFETSNLTGGVVTEVTLEEDRTDDGIGNLYKVKVHGREIYINSSDFYVYEVDERVGVIKIESVTEEAKTQSFIWADQERITEDQVDETIEPDVYQIIPIEFYNNDN